MAYFKSSTITGGAQHEANLHLYIHQIWAGPTKNQSEPVRTSNPYSFGTIEINDWPIREGRNLGSNVVARAHGMHAQCGQNLSLWDFSFKIVFEDDSLNGSTLDVRGVWDASSAPFEWAIVGGTGKFTLAQGIVSGKTLSEDSNSRIIEVFINVFYRTIERSTTRMFM
ncbi:dirigent protein 1-like [Carex rostrata]